ncbi:WD domain-containing protein [Colletotrichum graminicola M1.001]|uniref:WD domain-containing protein n=1 Tax=Colletotrichum graminicola (strain M1.001 / M2 / FGSC 10212) TaxID=645133 RepID=E3QM81_COLGM|nr:WD domain-containing protein [Colletotrichum graminicola M1.001]EFQ31969.1 WD domain-containing protein [Colletotrichum graminicola M1.001]
MHFLGHRRSASQQSIDPETLQQPQQQWRPHHQHRLSASSALYQAARALGSIGVPTAAATTTDSIASANTANANNHRPPLPTHHHSQRPSVSSQYSSYGQPSLCSPQHQQQEQQQQQGQSGYFLPNHHHQPLAASGPALSPPTSSLQYTPGAASATTPASGPPLPKEPPVANFRWDDEYYTSENDDGTTTTTTTTTTTPNASNNRGGHTATFTPAATADDSACARPLQPHHSSSQSHSYSPSFSSSSNNNNPHTHSLSRSHSQQQQQRASIPAALLPAQGLQPHRDSTCSLRAHSTATETSGPPGLNPSIALFSDPSSSPSSSSVPAMNQQQQKQQQPQPQPQPQSPPQFQSGTPRRTGTYSSQHEELHMPAGMMQHGQLSPREYSSSSAAPATPHIKLDQASPNAPQYQNTSSVPNVLQPGGPGNRPSAVTANTAPALSTMQPQQSQDYQTPSKPANLSLSHSYSRSSPAAGYEGASTFAPYTPTTPSGSGSQFMSPPEQKYNAPGSQRNISNTPLGLADIRPRADSSMSDGVPGSVAYELANAQPGTSNYLAPWALYAFDWCKWPPQGNGAGKLAVGSYLEDGHNYIQILDTQMVPTPNDVYQPGTPKFNLEFSKVAEATHSYPVTRLLWEPPSSQKQSTDLLATSGDHLRLWSLPSENPVSQSNSITRQARDPAITKLTPLALLSNSKTPDHTAPLTSLDWNTVSPSLIITSSIDTTCTIWDIPSLTAKTQLIAHDKEVYDVRFCANSVDVFVSCGQDGSVRMFDLRSLEHSTIIYEPTGKDDRDANGGRISPTLAQQTMSNPPPLLRLATSPHDTHLLATFAQDSNVIRILDVRHPGQALLELRGHGGSLNSIEWSPTRRGVLASGADDCQVLLWDVYNNHSLSGGPPANGAAQPDNTRSPYASWQCDYEVGNLAWVPHLSTNDQGEWLGVSAGRGLWGVKTCGRAGA